MNIRLHCTFCETTIQHELQHPKYGFCYICHKMLQCLECNSFLKLVDYDELVSALEHVTSNNRCKLGTDKKRECIIYNTAHTEISLMHGEQIVIHNNIKSQKSLLTDVLSFIGYKP